MCVMDENYSEYRQIADRLAASNFIVRGDEVAPELADAKSRRAFILALIDEIKPVGRQVSDTQ